MDKFVQSLVSFSLKNHIIVFFMTALLVAEGIISYINTPIEAFPDVTNTRARIITQWPGRMAMTTVVGIDAFLGPSQAGVRVFELLFSRNGPVKTAIISAVVTLLSEHLRLSWRRRKGILPISECLPE